MTANPSGATARDAYSPTAAALSTVVVVGPLLHAALALTSLATLVYELALMRLFSVTLWYYFAFFGTRTRRI